MFERVFGENYEAHLQSGRKVLLLPSTACPTEVRRHSPPGRNIKRHLRIGTAGAEQTGVREVGTMLMQVNASDIERV
jgi:hypothetical protein